VANIIGEIIWASAREHAATSRSGIVKQEATKKGGVCTNDIHRNDEYLRQEQSDVG
jgi:hypothetical protein